MGYAILGCGCVIQRSMFPPHDVTRLPCKEHGGGVPEMEADDGNL